MEIKHDVVSVISLKTLVAPKTGCMALFRDSEGYCVAHHSH